MIVFQVSKNVIKNIELEVLTSGSVNVYDCCFSFSDDWDGLEKIVTFRSGKVTIQQLLDSTNTCKIPWEVLVCENVGKLLFVGVRGIQNDPEEIVLPTIWTFFGPIKKGTTSGAEPSPPSPDIYFQLIEKLTKKGDALSYDGKTLSLLSGDKELSSVDILGSGASDHRDLTNRDAEDQHPIEAISGLEKISNDHILKIWKSGEMK